MVVISPTGKDNSQANSNVKAKIDEDMQITK